MNNKKINTMREFKEGFAAVEVDKMWGFINIEEEYLLEPKYDRVTDFKNGRAYIEKNVNGEKKGGTIDNQGNIFTYGEKKLLKEVMDTDNTVLKVTFSGYDVDGIELYEARKKHGNVYLKSMSSRKRLDENSRVAPGELPIF